MLQWALQGLQLCSTKRQRLRKSDMSSDQVSATCSRGGNSHSMKETKYTTSPRLWHDHKPAGKNQAKIVLRSSLTSSYEKIFLEIGRRAKGEIYWSQQNPCSAVWFWLNANQPSSYFPSGTEESENRDEIWVFLNYWKCETALEDVSKESCGRKNNVLYKTVFFTPNWDCNSQLDFPC